MNLTKWSYINRASYLVIKWKEVNGGEWQSFNVFLLILVTPGVCWLLLSLYRYFCFLFGGTRVPTQMQCVKSVLKPSCWSWIRLPVVLVSKFLLLLLHQSPAISMDWTLCKNLAVNSDPILFVKPPSPPRNKKTPKKLKNTKLKTPTGSASLMQALKLC